MKQGPGPDTYRFLARSLPGPIMPYKARPGDLDLNCAPICYTCKQKNYTKTHCRKKQQHTFLPWSTVFVMLYAIPYTNAVSDAEGSPQAAGMKRNKPEGAIDSSEPPEDKKFKMEEAAPTTEPNPAVEGPSPAKSEGLSTLDKIESSRTFLLTIQPDETSAVAWLDFDPEGSKNFVPPTSAAEDNERNFHNMTNGMYSSNMPSSYHMEYPQSMPPGGGGYGPPSSWHHNSGGGGAFPPYGEYDMPPHYAGGGYHSVGGPMGDYGNGSSYPTMDQGGYPMDPSGGGGGPQNFNPYFNQMPMHPQSGTSPMSASGVTNMYANAPYYDSFMPGSNMPQGGPGMRGMMPGGSPTRSDPKNGKSPEGKSAVSTMEKELPQGQIGLSSVGNDKISQSPSQIEHATTASETVPAKQEEVEKLEGEAKEQPKPPNEGIVEKNSQTEVSSDAKSPTQTKESASPTKGDGDSSVIPNTATEVAV